MNDNRQIQHQFGAQLRDRRKRRKLTQEKLGEVVDLHRTYISKVECGRANLTLCAIVRLASALEVTASDLLKGLEARRPAAQ